MKINERKDNAALYISVTAAAISGYVCALLTLESSGIVSAIPWMIIFSLGASFFCRKLMVLCALMGIMPLAVICLYGYSLERAVFVALVAAAIAYFTVLAKRAVYTLRKSGRNRSVRIKSIIVFCISVSFAFGLTEFAFGNIFSAAGAKADNIKYISDRYKKSLETSYTFYDAKEGAYNTRIFFDRMDINEMYYVSASSRDDYHDFCKEKITDDARMYFERMTTLDAESIKCTFDSGETVLTPETDYKEFIEDMEYLLVIGEKMENITDFQLAFGYKSNYVALLKMSDTLKFKSVTAFGRCNDGAVCLAVLTPDGNISYSFLNEKNVKALEEKFDVEL